MNSQDIQNLQESYLAVYDDDTRETLEFGNWVNDLLDEGYNLSDYTWDELYETYIGEERAPGVKPYEPRKRRPLDPEKAPSGEMGDGSGYGADEKFKKPDDKIEKPGTEVPAPKKGGYGRILSNIPYGIGAHANRQRSRNSTVRGMDPGAPRSEKLAPKEKKKASKEVVRKEEFELWVNNLLDEGYDLSGYTWEGLYEEYILNEAYDLYDVILSHLINEGYADTFEAAEAIMVNMSEDWRESICESILDTGATIAGSVVGTAQRAVKNVGQKMRNVAGTYEYARQKANSGGTYTIPKNTEYTNPAPKFKYVNDKGGMNTRPKPAPMPNYDTSKYGNQKKPVPMPNYDTSKYGNQKKPVPMPNYGPNFGRD